MSELRRDPIVGRWVIVKTKDVWMPQDYEKEDNSIQQLTTSPFLPGREKMTPPEVDAVRPQGSKPNASDWQVRVVPNKFPALKIEGDLDRRGVGLYDMSNGVGAHEIVIETPDPYKQTAELTEEETELVIRMYQNRCVSLGRDKRFKYIMVFKNFGRSAGTSIDHSHSQIIALPMVPKIVQEKIDGAANYYRYRGRNVYADLIQQEYEEKDRIVTENEDFLAFCPFVPRYAFETWIFPKDEASQFTNLEGKTRLNLARILKDILVRIKECLDNPSYNFYLHIAPANEQRTETFLWHIEVVPKLSRLAGFEWGTGFYVVHTPPEVAAKCLREVEAGQSSGKEKVKNQA